MTYSARVIFCDDIRQEITGKFILIGVYTGEMVAHGEPIVTNVALWIEVSGLDIGEHNVHLKVVLTAEDEIISSGEVDSTVFVHRQDLPVHLIPPPLPVQVGGEGALIVSIQIDAEAEVQIGSLRTSLEPIPSAK